MALENKLGLTSSDDLAREEERISKKKALALFENGVLDTLPAGKFSTLQAIHKYLFEDIYDFAGKLRTVNLAKGNFRFAPLIYLEAALANIDRMPQSTFDEIIEKYVEMNIAHPFREGNTRTVVMMMTFFVEQHGYFMDQELLAASAGYVRDSFVMASLDQFSEYEHLERILLDAVQSAPIHYDVETLCDSISPSSDRYSKYQREPYKPLPHYKRET